MKITHKFEAFIKKFIEDFRLLNPHGLNIIAVSGGVDSMVLLNVYQNIHAGLFEVIHFNHGTRAENDYDEKLVKEFCDKNKIKLHIIKLNFNLAQSNFEKRAREERLKYFREFISKGYYVVTAHHLDDSFEWHLMQKFKQSRNESSLGIPVFNKHIVRPLLCVSKNQIYRYAKEANVIWNEDTSNHNTKFERNYLRQFIVEKIAKKYPQYLRHYVNQQNSLAFKYNLHRQLHLHAMKKAIVVPHFITGTVIKSSHLENCREEIYSVIKNLSNKKRGEINQQVEKIIASQKTYKSDPTKLKFFGPFMFSGSVCGVLFKDCLHLFSSNEIHKLDHWDKDFIKNAQIPFGFENKNNPAFFPNICVSNMRLNQETKFKKSKLVYPYLKETINSLKKSDIPYCFFV